MTSDFQHALEYVDAFLHEALSVQQAEAVERHCERCPVCKVALEEARKRQAALAAVPTCEASESLVRNTLKRVAQEGPRRERRRRWAVGGAISTFAASVLLLLGLQWYFGSMQASPYEVVVLGQNRWLAAAQGSLRVRVIDHFTGAAVAGVPVEVELRGQGKTVRLAQFTTDSAGSGAPSFHAPDWPEGDYTLHVVARPSAGAEVLTQPIKLTRSWKLMLSSDKPVYQPGQAIHLRALALRKPDLHPVAGEDAVFTIADAKGNVVFKQRCSTSQYGIAFVDCPLATEINEGAYAISCVVGDTESKQTVEVKKYVLPKFKIDVAGLEPYYRPGQKVTGTVRATYHFGKPVTGAEVKVALGINDLEPFPGSDLTVRTDDEGNAPFAFALPRRLAGLEKGDARFVLDVFVADAAGQKGRKSVGKAVTAQPLRLDIVPEGGTLVQGVVNKVYVHASHADGLSTRARLTVAELGLDWSTTDGGVGVFDITPKAAAVSLSVRAVDAKGNTARRDLRLACGTRSDDFLLRTDRAVYDGGQTVHIIALGGGTEPVFVDLIKDGQTVLTQTVPMANGRGDYHFDLPADLFGTLELNAYRFQASGVPMRAETRTPRPWDDGGPGLAARKTRVLLVRPASRVNVRAELDRKEYRPGEKAKLQLRLTDSDGRPKPGAISLSAVDEAVYSVQDQAPGMEGIFYHLDRELLRPVFAMNPGWSPDARNEEGQLLAQALFARTAWAQEAQAGGPRGSMRSNLPAVVVNGAQGMGGAAPAGEPSPYTLTAGSFGFREQEVNQTRETGLTWVARGWLLLIGMSLVGGCVALWVFFLSRLSSRVFDIILFIGVGIAVFLFSIISISTNPNSTFNKVATALQQPGGAGGGVPAADSGPPRPLIVLEIPMPRLPESREPNAPAAAEPGGIANVPNLPTRVREWFPETLLWEPNVITDDQGAANVDLALADSITDWRLSGSAVAADGSLGALHSSIRVFQPFFVDLDLPVALTRGDEVEVSAVVHNHLDKPQTVELTLKEAPWFESRAKELTKSIELGPREVRAARFPIRVVKVGKQKVELAGRGAGVADALTKDIDVIPDGQRVERVVNGALGRQPTDLALNVPANAIEGSPQAILKVYPSNFSTLVEGLDAIFQMPSGCFEQTSSTTYPNVLALDYLRRTGKNVPAVEAKAKQYINLGYQRLLTFEVPGGGFEWFGHAPANQRLTAYGLMEFEDMAKVHDVDPKLIARTRQWLLDQRQADGSWLPDGRDLHQANLSRLAQTAYVATAVFARSAQADPRAGLTRAWLLRHRPDDIADPYLLALVANALKCLDPKGDAATPYLQRLDKLKRGEGSLTWWEQTPNGRTAFHGSGRSGSVETTALATLALLSSGQSSPTCRQALTWVAQQKDAAGTWHSTQATVLALKALLAGTEATNADKPRSIEVRLNDGAKRTIAIAPDQNDVLLQRDLSDALTVGDNRLSLAETTGAGVSYQLAFRYHVPAEAGAKAVEPLGVTLTYDKTDLSVDDTSRATAVVVNRMKQASPMVMLDLPIPPGFAIDADEWTAFVRQEKIARVQIGVRQVLVYLRNLDAGEELKLTYSLRATMPVKVTAPPARAYEYYNPDTQGFSRATRLTVASR